MTFPSRRSSVTRLLCSAFASVIFGGYSAAVHAQAPAPLRVDPVLLGLPPIKPEQAPAPARPPVAVEKSRTEVTPVEAMVVESRPVKSEPAPSKSIQVPREESVSPQVSPVVATPPSVSAPQPVRRIEPAAQPPLPARLPVVASPAPAIRPTPQQYPLASAGKGTSSLAPLRVDPALLGLPPMSAQSSVMSGITSPGAAVTSFAGRAQVAMAPAARKPAEDGKSWYQRLWAPVASAYDLGTLELYLPFETYHLRSKYSQEKIATYQEKPKGFGVGRGYYNEKGNWEGVYAMAFQDSHFMPMYFAGYGWRSIWRPTEDTRVGLGYVAGLMSRTDIWGYKPFPIALPSASIAFKNFSLEGTFIPGGKGWGNVAFFWAKWELGKTGEAIGTPMRTEPPLMPTEMLSTTFGSSVPLASQRVPYGPVLDTGSAGSGDAAGTGVRPASSAAVVPPQVAPSGWRDEEEVPDVLPPLALRASKSMVPQSKDSAVPRPVFLSAYRMGGLVDREFNAEGDAELRKIGTVLTSDRLTYWPTEDEVEAEGNVRLEQGQDVITGPKMRLKMEDQVGYFEQPSYLLKRQPQPGSKAATERAFAEQFLAKQGGSDWSSGFAAPIVINPALVNSSNIAQTNADARGEADRIDFEGENQIRMTNGTFTTCAPGDTDWYAKANDLKLDYDHEVGEGKHGVVYFKDVPILYSPWLSFSLNQARKSGLMAPTYSMTSDSGLSLRIPYYWNIAPNKDATIATRILSKRGTMLSSEFRYLDAAFGGQYSGELRAEVLPNDKLRENENRYGISFLHRLFTSTGFSGLINYNKVSDGNYFTDLTSNVVTTSQTQLLQQGMLSYGGGGWWNASANFQQYQTLQPDPKNPVLEQYRMLPQITVNARKPDLYLTDSSFMGQYTAFSKPKQVINGASVADANGQRLVLYPQVALPYVTPGWYVTPKLGVNMRNYSLSGQAEGSPGSISTTLPIFSTDSGMTFERSSKWFGRDYTQTLEPRLFYLNIPYRDQSKIPLFDTGLADFNFAQIFSENQFSSWDRINNANQLTAAATTRLLEPNTGSEIMRAMVGQRFYLSKNQVSLVTTSTALPDDRKSDFLAAFSGQILPRVYADFASQYSVSDKQMKRYSMGIRYLPEPGKVLNAAYRYNRDETSPVDQIDLSGQWPITGRWYGVGRWNYSFRVEGSTLTTTSLGTTLSSTPQSGRVIQSLAGLEYNGGCWVVRGVLQKLALTQDSSSTGFFLQLELSDFASIGSNPINMLRRNIQGYSLINQPVADPVFGQ
ncbi:MAG: lipid IV(A) palmitoyltransferase PagP [Betaproteobacteria bacterium]